MHHRSARLVARVTAEPRERDHQRIHSILVSSPEYDRDDEGTVVLFIECLKDKKLTAFVLAIAEGC